MADGTAQPDGHESNSQELVMDRRPRSSGSAGLGEPDKTDSLNWN